MDSINDPRVHTIYWMKSSQVGATEVLNNIVGYFMAHDPCPILKMDPTVEMGEDWSKRRLSTMLRDTPALANKVRDAKSRDSGNTILNKIFPGGSLSIVGANSPSGLASRPIRLVVADEADRYPASAGTEGDPLDLARKRQTTFWNRKLFVPSTPTVKGASRIEAGYNESDQRKFWTPCQHCGAFQVFMWKHVTWPEGEPEKAHLVCEACACEISERDRLRGVRDGRWRAGAEFKGIAGFWTNELVSPFSTVGKMATEFTAAVKFKDRLRVFVNTSLGETWEEEPEGETLDFQYLLDRVQSDPEPYGLADVPVVIPDRGVYLTAAVDRQKDRLEVKVKAWGPHEESWLIDYKVITHDPSRPPRWEELTEFLQGEYAHELGCKVPISAITFDTGGHDTDGSYGYCKQAPFRKFYPIKGHNERHAPIIPKKATAIKSKHGRLWLYVVGVHQAKDVVYGNLQITEAGPGCLHFPQSTDATYFKGMTAERRVVKYSHGQPFHAWVKAPGVANEPWDLENYNLIAFRLAKPNLDAERAALVAKSTPRKEGGNPPPATNTGGFVQWGNSSL